MIKRQFGKVLQPFVLLLMLLTSGCAQQMKSVQPDAAPEALVNAELKSITVADDASRIEILSDKPIVYTYYMLDTPPRLVVDLAQTTSGSLSLPIEVNRGSIKRIDVAKHEFGSGLLSRIDVLLADKVEVVATLDQQNNHRLILNVPVPPMKAAVPAMAPAIATAPVMPAAEPVQVVDPQPVTGESTVSVSGVKGAPPAEAAKTETGGPGMVRAEQAAPETPAMGVTPAKLSLKPGERGLTAIISNEDSVQLEIAGGVESFKVFRLTQPERLVIDIPKTRNALSAKVLDINRFNLGKARVGGSPEKLRIVFDAVGTTIPAYTVTRNSAGLLIAFGDAQKKAGSGSGEQGTRKAEIAQQPVVEAAPVPAAVVAEVPKEAALQPSAAAKSVAAPPLPVKQTVKKPLGGTVDAVEFTQSEGISRITVRTTGNCNAGQTVKTAKGLSLTLKDCRLPVKLQRQLDTSGFESAIQSIAPFSVKGKTAETRIAVTMRGTLPYSLKRDGDTLEWSFTEPVKAYKQTKSARAPKTASAEPPRSLLTMT